MEIVLLFSAVLSACLTRRVINAVKIFLFKSTIRLNNPSSDKKNIIIIGRLIFNHQQLHKPNYQIAIFF